MRVSVVTCFIVRQDGRLLVLRRSSQVGSYRGKWAGVSGYLDVEDPLEQAWTEIGEEIGLSEHQLGGVVAGPPLEVRDETLGKTWLVHPFRFRLEGNPELKLDWEHVEMRWVVPRELRKLDTVPKLWESWRRVESLEAEL